MRLKAKPHETPAPARLAMRPIIRALMSESAFDDDAFLAQHLSAQRERLACHRADGEALWLWRIDAAPRHRRALALVARLSGTPALRPPAVIAPAAAVTALQAAWLTLAEHGIRVPRVAAQSATALLLRGPAGEPFTGATLASDLAAAHGGELPVLWQQGLALLDGVHAAGLSLGGAFADQLPRCADARLACIGAAAAGGAGEPPELGQVRDALGYLWSTASHLHLGGQREAARALWQAWVAQPLRGDAFRALLARHLAALSWLRYLPPDSRWGSTIYQMRAAYEQAVKPRYGESPALDSAS